MERVSISTDRVPLPLHDEIYVPECDLQVAYKHLTHVLQERELDVKVKVDPDTYSIGSINPETPEPETTNNQTPPTYPPTHWVNNFWYPC